MVNSYGRSESVEGRIAARTARLGSDTTRGASESTT